MKTGPDEIDVGDTAVYEITVTNDGPGVAQDVVLTDQYSPGFVFKGTNQPPGVCTNVDSPLGGVVTCNLGMLPQGVKLVTISLEGFGQDGPRYNCAAISSNPPDDPAGNQSGVNCPPEPRARMARAHVAARAAADARANTAQAGNCSGTVLMRITVRRRTVLRRRTALRPDCRFARTLRFSKRRIPRRYRRRTTRVTVVTTFEGNPSLAASADVESVRVRRARRARRR